MARYCAKVLHLEPNSALSNTSVQVPRGVDFSVSSDKIFTNLQGQNLSAEGYHISSSHMHRPSGFCRVFLQLWLCSCKENGVHVCLGKPSAM